MLVAAAIIFGTASSWPARRRRMIPVISGGAAGLLANAFGPVPLLPVLLLAVPLAARLAEIDLSCLRLPDRLVGALAVLLGVPLTLAASGTVRAVTAALTVGGGYLVIALLPGRGLGLGDVKLAAVLSYALGFAGWPAVVIGAVVPHLITGPIALFLLVRRRADGRTALPLGPALLTGALIAAVCAA